MTHHRLFRLCLPALAILALAGCDPKKLDGTTGDTTTGGNNTDSTVTSQAIAVGNILSLQSELIRAGISVAAQFDTAAAPAPMPRGILSEGCWSVTEADTSMPIWALRLDGCTDAHGTSYRGGGEFAPVDTLDGYAFFPWGEPDLLRATNDSNDDYSHNINSGSLEFQFTRSAGAVNGVDIGRYLRHDYRAETVTFSYNSVHYSGAPGSFGDYPDTGSVVGVVWSGVGIFDITFGANGTATFTMQGANYLVDLATGDVSVAPN